METQLTEALVKCTKELIYYGTIFNLEAFNKIYADDLRIVRLDENGNIPME